MFQACQSPFRANADDMYAYNFMWMGSHKWYQSLWSVNIMEHQPSEYIYYVALGNQFTFGNFRLHAIYNHTLGHNGNTSGVLQPDNSMFFIGLKWKVDVVSSIKKVFNINSAQ